MATLPHYLVRCYCSSDLLNLFICLISSRFNFGVSGNPALRLGKPGCGVGLGYGLRFKSQFGHFVVDYAINAFQQKTVYFGISNLASWMQQAEEVEDFTPFPPPHPLFQLQSTEAAYTTWYSLLIQFQILQHPNLGMKLDIQNNWNGRRISCFSWNILGFHEINRYISFYRIASGYSLKHIPDISFLIGKRNLYVQIYVAAVIEYGLMHINFLCDLVLFKFV